MKKALGGPSETTGKDLFILTHEVARLSQQCFCQNVLSLYDINKSEKVFLHEEENLRVLKCYSDSSPISIQRGVNNCRSEGRIWAELQLRITSQITHDQLIIGFNPADMEPTPPLYNCLYVNRNCEFIQLSCRIYMRRIEAGRLVANIVWNIFIFRKKDSLT